MIRTDEWIQDGPPDEVRLWPEAARELGSLVHALCAQRRSALLACEDAQQMDLISLHLWRLLRRQAGLRLELIQPTGTESLLDRFNERMMSMPMDAARHEPPPSEPLLLWVLKLSRRLELPEIRLLLKLIQDFPGAGVRLLLVCSGEAARHRDAADWGLRIHRCMVAAPGARLPVQEANQTAVAPVAAGWRGRIRSYPGLERVARLTLTARRWWGAVRTSMAPRVVRCRMAPLSRRRWAIGLGSVLVSVSGAAAAWWQARADEGAGAAPALRRPVPEVVELLEDVRPRSIREDRTS